MKKSTLKISLPRNSFFVALLCLIGFSGLAQTSISGTVTDTSNEPIPGVNIVVKNTSAGAVTDFDGKYTIEAPEGAEVLVFSYIGYTTLEVPINGRTTIDVVLEEGGFGLEEVVVTSRKQSENLQEVPVSVSAFSVKSLESKGIGNVAQIADYIPNVEIDVTSTFGGSQSVFSPFIRGIGQLDFAITSEPGVGLYVDGVYFGRSVGSIVDLLDVARVEALKGPQGTLFGRNTIGGAISVTTKDPSDTFSAQGQLTTGNFNRLDVKVSVDVPLVEDKLLSSFSVSSVNRDGYVERIPFEGPVNADLANPRGLPFRDVNLDGDQGQLNNDTWRAKFVWRASDNFKATLSADYERVRENQNASTLLEVFNEVNGAPTIVGAYNGCAAGQLPPQICAQIANAPGLDLTGATPFDSRFITGDPFTNFATADAGSRIDAWGGSLTLDWNLSETLDFKSITAIRSLDSQFQEDQDFSPVPFATAGFVMPQDQFTQEFQLIGSSDRFKWVGGLFFFTEDGSVLDQVVLGNGLVQVFGLNLVNNQSYAAFAQGTYNLTDRWSVTAGARLTHEIKELDGRQRDFNSFAVRTSPPGTFPLPDPNDPTLYFPAGVQEQTFTEPTFRLGTEYKFADNIFGYGYFAQGFKSGGWTTRVTAPVTEAPTFAPENANTFEVGFKTDFAQNTFRLNVSAFLTDYQNIQITVQRGISPFTENVAEAEIKGIELETQWRPSENLLLTGNFGWIDASYTNVADPNAIVNENSSFVNTPEFSGNVSLDYTIPLGQSKGRLLFHIDAVGKSEIFNDAENTAVLRQDGITLLNSSLSLESEDRRWKLSLGGTNITNETYVVGGFTNPGVGNTFGIYARPAEFNAGVTYRIF